VTPAIELGHHRIRQLAQALRVKPGIAVRLPHDFDPSFTADFGDEGAKEAQAALQKGVELLSEYQTRLAAQDTDALLVVIQGMDASGKDGTIEHVMSGVNPQGVVVWSFKAPSEEELSHDYLWRAAKRLPARGMMGIFNRSHYEEVLIVRVHREALDAERLPPASRDADIWHRRFREINEWEHYLVDNGIHVVKLFLNVSKEEQRRRFLKRIDEPEKNWKFTAADVHERKYWDDYQRAYADVLSETSTDWAPWYVIPADHKWFARIAAAAVIVETMIGIDPQYPSVSAQQRHELDEARKQLLAESPSSRR
jgi:PPK2 family polyphosphate:nucleotide phosphotransferase